MEALLCPDAEERLPDEEERLADEEDLLAGEEEEERLLPPLLDWALVVHGVNANAAATPAVSIIFNNDFVFIMLNV